MTATCLLLGVLLDAGQTRTGKLAFESGRDVDLVLKSTPVDTNGHKLSVLTSGKAVVDRVSSGQGDGSVLTATLHCGIAQYSTFDYRLTARVFDRRGREMAKSTVVEHVQYIRVGTMPTLFREIRFDFGRRDDWGRAKTVQFDVDSPRIPRPPEG